MPNVTKYFGCLLVIVALLAVSMEIAAADSIDGYWCTPDGRQFNIDGDVIVTENGTKITGDYGRHHYVFTLPPEENMGGTSIDVVLIEPNVAHARYVSYLGKELNAFPEVWTRCQAATS